MESGTQRLQVALFIIEQIDSVPQLEALLLLFNSRPKTWSIETMAKSLYVRSDVAVRILDTLLQRKLIAVHSHRPDVFYYASEDDYQNRLMEAVDAVYRKDGLAPVGLYVAYYRQQAGLHKLSDADALLAQSEDKRWTRVAGAVSVDWGKIGCAASRSLSHNGDV